MKLFILQIFIASLSIGTTLVAAADATGAIGDCDTSRQDSLTCMACNLYHEAAREPIECKEAIALVVMNRLNHGGFGQSVCNVIWQPAQFSWTHDGKNDWVYAGPGWDESIAAAQLVLSGEYKEDITENSLWYHADYVTPNWAKDYTLVGKCGYHLFYR